MDNFNSFDQRLYISVVAQIISEIEDTSTVADISFVVPMAMFITSLRRTW